MDRPNGPRDTYRHPDRSVSGPEQPLRWPQPAPKSKITKRKQNPGNSVLSLLPHLISGTWSDGRELPLVTTTKFSDPPIWNTMPDNTLDTVYTFPNLMDQDPLSDESLTKDESQFAAQPNSHLPNGDVESMMMDPVMMASLMMGLDNGQSTFPLQGASQSDGRFMSLPPRDRTFGGSSPQTMSLPGSIMASPAVPSPPAMPSPQTARPNLGPSMTMPSGPRFEGLPLLQPPAAPHQTVVPAFSAQPPAPPQQATGHSQQNTPPANMSKCCWDKLKYLVDECAREAGMSTRNLFRGLSAPASQLQDPVAEDLVERARGIAVEAVRFMAGNLRVDADDLFRRLAT